MQKTMRGLLRGGKRNLTVELMKFDLTDKKGFDIGDLGNQVNQQQLII